MGNSSAPPPPLCLGPEADLAHGAELLATLRSALGEASVTLDATAVERVDAAGLQLLLAFVRALDVRGIPLSWAGASPRLREAARLLGLGEALALPVVD